MTADPAPPGNSTLQGVAGQLVTGVSIVVTLVDGEPLATTAGSVVVASMDPPLIAVLFRNGSRMDVALDLTKRFTVNVVNEADHGVARRFARHDRGQGWDAFSNVRGGERASSVPILRRAVAWLDCTVTQIIPIGDHRCFIGEVLDAGRDSTASPLAYYRGRFRGLGEALAPVGWNSLDTIDLTSSW